MDEKMLCEELEYSKFLSSYNRNKFFPKMEVKEIRNWLEEHNLDRHMLIELNSTEICILTPDGAFMQIRPTDSNKLGMWGGVLNADEYVSDTVPPRSGAYRELGEEIGFEKLPGVKEENLEFVEWDDHLHTYTNGDKALFHCARFVLRINYSPKIVNLDDETSGSCYVKHTILSHQQEFISRMLGEK